MNTIKKLFLFVILTTTINSTAFAGNTMLGNALNIMNQISDLADEFNLTDQQKAQIRSVLWNYLPGIATKAGDMMSNRQQLLQNSLYQDDIDEQLIAEIANRQGELLSEIIIAKEHMKKELRSKLTASQKDFVDELLFTLIQTRLGFNSQS